MNKLYCLIILFISCRICEGQNLVPNGSFESYSSCPTSWNQIDTALFWTTPTTNISAVSGTPDYFNQCSISIDVGVPNNYFGYQQPHTGNAYAGIYVWYGNVPNTREYVEVPLTSSLSSGTCYHFEMYVNIGDICNYTVDNIGIYFSDTLVSGINNQTVLPFLPQINNTAGNYFDNLNWILVSGDYTASGGESYLIIGNFNDDASSDTVVLGIGTFDATYAYIDDVSLIQVPPCNTGTNETNANVSFKINPNPFKTELTIDMNSDEFLEIILYDPTSRKLLQEKFISIITLNTEQLATGIYLYEVRNKNGVIKKGKVVKD